MQGVNKLVWDYSRANQPIAAGMTEEEASSLVERLRTRLNATAEELDLSASSLKRLEQWLVELHAQVEKQAADLTQEELFPLIREIAAYWGLVMVKQANARWRTGGTLWGTEVEIGGPIQVIEGKEHYLSPYPTIYSLGNVAANTWDLVTEGSAPKLYRTFHNARKKVSKQEL